MKTCPICGEPLEAIMTEQSRKVYDAFKIFMDVEIGQTYPIACRCAADKRDEERKKAEMDERVSIMRKRGIADAQTLHMRFENDLGYNPAICAKAKKYVVNFEKMSADNIGIVFTGGVGTGKTFYAACIANALIDKGLLAVFTSFSRIIRTPFEDYEQMLKLLERAALVVFDDIGTERDSSFGLERAYDAVDARIKARKPIIVTTNFTPDEMSRAADIKQKRIFDRIMGACIIIPVNGKSIRMIEQNKKMDAAGKLLGGK